jgi:hypothetical protein
VVEPVQAAVDALQQNIVATSQVTLDGLKSHLRTMETNEGNLVADALLWQAARLAADFGVPAPDIGIQNGGGVRNNSEIPPGDLSEFDTFSILPFPNFVTVIPDLPRGQIKEIFENAVSRVEFVDGRFAQVSGMSLVWDPNGTAQVLDADQNVVTPGTRVVRIALENGDVIVDNGAVQPGPPVTVATIDFLATGGDEYPFRGAAYTKLGVTYQQALRNYLAGGLGGVVTAALYPEGDEGRITTGTALNNLFAKSPAPERDYDYALEQNHPNPFNPTTSIRFTLPAAGAYTLTVYDIAGRSVWKSNGSGSVGPNSVVWNGVDSRGSSVASGVYFYKLTSGTFSQTRKMTLMK